jgi:hypothetical protein
MFTVVKGPLSYDAIKNVNGFQHETFREACFAMGFLEDDREFIATIKEAHPWGSRHFFKEIVCDNVVVRICKQTQSCLGKDRAPFI